METNIKAVILAAGKGTRLITEDDDSPKVMRKACGKPLLWHVLQALSFIRKEDTIVVAGYRKEEVMESFGGYIYAVQTEQLGTGHAVMAAGDELRGFGGSVLVCCGDMPAIRRETYEALVKVHFDQDNDCTMLTGESAISLPYGRIIRGADGAYLKTVEERDCTAEQLAVTELNSGVYIFRAQNLLDALRSLKSDNAQGEYYLTDVPAIMRAGGARIGICKRDLGDEIIGVNTQEQLLQVEEILRRR